jgi:hypothetical protein
MPRSVPIGYLDNGGYITKEVVNLDRITEMKREYLTRLPYLNWDSTKPGSGCQMDTILWVHDQRIVQRITDCYIAIRGHHSQEKTFSDSQCKEETHLSGTVQQRNASFLSPNADQNPGESD